MKSSWSARGALALVVTSVQGPGVVEPLPPGPHPVGFRSSIELDTGRSYRTAYDQGATYGGESAARPILVLLWYPAVPAAATRAHLPYGEHLALHAPEARLAPFAAALAAHARGIFVQQVTGKAEAELSDDEELALGVLLETPCGCVAGAEPAPGPFPLVVHHSGAGSSFEDDAGLCESLASHGYVVVASAYPEADGSSLGIDAGRGSSEDMHFLVRRARELPFVAKDRVAFVGHSAGAQAMARCVAVPGCPAEAVVLLDTTQDYYAPSLPLHETLVRELREGTANLSVPLLVAAGPGAMFALCDSLVGCERTYLTVPELGHDEFISQGLQRLDWLAARGSEEDPAHSVRVRANHAELRACVRLFLDAKLKGDAKAWEARVAELRTAVPGSDGLQVELAPRGVSGPEPWPEDSSVPPTPRQFRRIVLEQGSAAACGVLARFDDFRPRSPIYTIEMLAASLLYELESAHGVEAARPLYAAWRQRELAVLSVYTFLADISRMQAKPEQARAFLRLATELDPEDAAVKAALSALDAKPAPKDG
jgi:hypothetical protein